MRKIAPWVCSDCGKKLPSKGLVWASRERASREYRSRHDDAGYRCDYCADAIEGDGDY